MESAGISNVPEAVDPAVLREFHDQEGRSLADLSTAQPAVVVFLRHSGCTFCKQALRDLAAQRPRIQMTGSTIVVVHMMPSVQQAASWFANYGLGDVSQISDPSRKLYQAFKLQDGSVAAVAGPKVWGRGFKAMFAEGHFPGWPAGNELQLPGAFLLYRGEILQAYRHTTSADRPNYVDLATCEIPKKE